MSEPTKLESALDELLAGKTTEEIVGPGGLLKQLTKTLIERAMNAEMSHHLGYEKHAPEGRGSGNNRNGNSSKRVQGDFGAVEIEVPRDRNGTFEPKIIPKHERRFSGFDEKILSMYARGMSTRDTQGHLEEQYGVEVSPALISQVTDAVMEEVRAWQNRPLDPILPDRLSGRVVCEDEARGASGESGSIRGDRSESGRDQRSTGIMDQRHGGR